MKNELILIIKHLCNPDYTREEIVEELMEFFNKWFTDEWSND